MLHALYKNCYSYMDDAFAGMICEDPSSASWQVPPDYLTLLDHLYRKLSNFEHVSKGLVALVDSLWYKGLLTPKVHLSSTKRILDMFENIVGRVDLAISKGHFIEQNSRKKRCLTSIIALGDFINEIESQRRTMIDELRLLTQQNSQMSTETKKSINTYCKTLKKCQKPCKKSFGTCGI